MTALANSPVHQPPPPTVTRPLVLIADPAPTAWTPVIDRLASLGVPSLLAATSIQADRLAQQHRPRVCLVALSLAPAGARQWTALDLACRLRQLDPPPTVALTWPFPSGKTLVAGEWLPLFDTTHHHTLIALILTYAGWQPVPVTPAGPGLRRGHPPDG